MKIVIDTDIVEETTQLDVFLYLLSVHLNTPIIPTTFMRAAGSGNIEYERVYNTVPVNPQLNDRGIEYINETLALCSIPEKEKKDRFELLAEKLRELYPKGKKPGTNYMWRDSVSTIARKLRVLVKKNKASFTDDEAIAATKKYIESFNGDYRFMQLLKYFISKKDNLKEEETSQLLSFIENANDVDSNNQDWMSELK